MASPPLPQELIDKIIDQFSETARSNNNRTSNKHELASLSMVAKAWRERSQKHLFSVINFRELSSTDTTEADLDEFGLVFSLVRDLEIDGSWEVLFQFDSVAIASIRCFRNLESLSLTGWHFRWLSAEQLSTCFSHLGETLVHFKLDGMASSESLIYLTSMFPRLCTLGISIAAVHNEAGTIAKEELPTTGSFQGYLHLWGLSKEHNDFLAFLSSTSPRFETIRIDDCETGDGVGKLLCSSAASLESLDLYIDGSNLPSLSECIQLREVSISYPYSDSIASLLQTIRSPHLKKFAVFFRLWFCGRLTTSEDADRWRKADDELRVAYDQWTKRVAGTIEVSFCMPGVDISGYSLEGYRRDLKRFFPRFTENVAVTIVC